MNEICRIATVLREAAKALEQFGSHVPILDLALIENPETGKRTPRDPDMKLDAETLHVFWRGEQIPRLSLLEFELVEYLSRRHGAVRSRAEIIEALWPMNSTVVDRVVDSTIKRIRTAFRSVDPLFDRIRSVRGAGYAWEIQKET